MARKRSAAEIETTQQPRPRRAEAKRTKLSSHDEVCSNSSAPSSCSVSEDSALQSSPPASDHTRHSSFSSLQSAGYDESESSVSSSSEESSDEDSDDEDQVITLGGPKKPRISGEVMLHGAQDLHTRLSALLPQLAAANDELDKGGAGHNMEDVEEGEQHIEMNLGLGVLEEKQDGESSSDDSSDSETDLSDDTEAPVSSGAMKREQDGKEGQVMSKLLGWKGGQPKPGIEDLD